jgi:hypothetical protein
VVFGAAGVVPLAGGVVVVVVVDPGGVVAGGVVVVVVVVVSAGLAVFFGESTGGSSGGVELQPTTIRAAKPARSKDTLKRFIDSSCVLLAKLELELKLNGLDLKSS